MKRKFAIIWTVIIICVLIAAFTIIKIISNSQANLEQLADLQIQNVDLTKISDGVYTGSYSAFPISVKVKVTVSNHKITKIELIKHSNGQGAPAEIIPDRVREAQSLDVDIVSGATYSSKIILKSIENALNNAGDINH